MSIKAVLCCNRPSLNETLNSSLNETPLRSQIFVTDGGTEIPSQVGKLDRWIFIIISCMTNHASSSARNDSADLFDTRDNKLVMATPRLVSAMCYP